MKILFVAATRAEVAPLADWLATQSEVSSPDHYRLGNLQLSILYSGVGMAATAFSLGTVLARHPYELLIQLGIGGALDTSLALGQVVEISSEYFADLGAATATGDFLDLAQLGLLEQESGIFSAKGQLVNPHTAVFGTGLPTCQGISVNTVSGYSAAIESLRQRYPAAQVESMEGAAFFYACLASQRKFTQIRSISNYVTARDRASWDIPLAIQTLNRLAIELVESFAEAARRPTPPSRGI